MRACIRASVRACVYLCVCVCVCLCALGVYFSACVYIMRTCTYLSQRISSYEHKMRFCDAQGAKTKTLRRQLQEPGLVTYSLETRFICLLLFRCLRYIKPVHHNYWSGLRHNLSTYSGVEFLNKSERSPYTPLTCTKVGLKQQQQQQQQHLPF